MKQNYMAHSKITSMSPNLPGASLMILIVDSNKPSPHMSTTKVLTNRRIVRCNKGPPILISGFTNKAPWQF